jgi:5-methylthioadenosine/S-adenosylhomocysteine deaminase
LRYLFRDADIITLDENSAVPRSSSLVVNGPRIVYVGNEPPPIPFDRVIDCAGKIIMPGLVNAHTHTPMALLRGMSDDCSLEDWLSRVIWPVESALTKGDIACGTLLAAAEMLAYGTVSFSDMYRHSDTVAETVATTKMKANICESITNGEDSGIGRLERVRESIRMIDRWNGWGDGLIRCDTSIQSIFQTTPALWEFIAALAGEKGVGVHIHLGETKDERENCEKRYGKTPTRLLYDAGVLKNRVVAVHGTYLDGADIEILAGCGAHIVHDPASNLKTCCATARLKPFLDKGINVALGTDGVCSNNSGDLFATMRQTALLQKAFENDPAWMTANQTLRLAVAGGWASQGRAGESGVIAAGKDADLIILNGEHPGLWPNYDPVTTAVYAAQGGHVETVMVRGEILYNKGEYLTIDMEKLRHDVSQFARKARSRVWY